MPKPSLHVSGIRIISSLSSVADIKSKGQTSKSPEFGEEPDARIINIRLPNSGCVLETYTLIL